MGETLKYFAIVFALFVCLVGFAQGQNEEESLEEALERAANFDGEANSDWEIYTHTFEDGIEMALVPPGCFMMGLSEESVQAEQEELGLGDSYFEDLQPAHEICFETAFWVDVT